MRLGLIYKATNLMTNKCYIGQTVDFKRRKRDHRKNSFNQNREDYNSKFHSSIRKYGFENFKWEILQDNILEYFLNIFEQCYVAIHDSYYIGLNSTHGRR